MKTAIETYSGAYLDYLAPKPEDIELVDIARGLAQTCRFAGQTTQYYSVAEHAIYVARLVQAAGHPNVAFAALHHDSHEAYLTDWPTPLKEALGREMFNDMCDDIDRAIAARFGFPHFVFRHPAIHQADRLALRREAATLKYSHGVGAHWGFDEALTPLAGIGWSPSRAEREFLEWHEVLQPQPVKES